MVNAHAISLNLISPLIMSLSLSKNKGPKTLSHSKISSLGFVNKIFMSLLRSIISTLETPE